MRFKLTLLVILCSTINCYSQILTPREGYVNVQGGRIWYKIIGSGKKTPLLFIHGGPGSTSCSYISVLSTLSNERPVILYDQLGTGRSDRPTDTTLWKLPLFVNEIDSLRAALGLKKVHIVGHSWGGTVLIEYLISKKPKGVTSAIFVSPLLSTPIWMEDAKILLSRLPQNIQDTINKYEGLKDYDAPSYLKATDTFYAKHVSVKQWPPAKSADCSGIRGNGKIYRYMWGSSEFNATGTLINFDRTSNLKQLKLPVFFIAGEFDEARPETMYRFQKNVRNSKVSIIENAGHYIQVDQPEKFTKAISQFINSLKGPLMLP